METCFEEECGCQWLGMEHKEAVVHQPESNKPELKLSVCFATNL